MEQGLHERVMQLKLIFVCPILADDTVERVTIHISMLRSSIEYHLGLVMRRNAPAILKVAMLVSKFVGLESLEQSKYQKLYTCTLIARIYIICLNV